MTIFDVKWYCLLICLCVAITVSFLMPKPEPKPPTRIQKTIIILDKKWDKWIERNKSELTTK